MKRTQTGRDAGGDDGFTLIEVLVALVILSLSSVVLLAIFSQSLSRARDSERAMAARLLAQSLLIEASSDVHLKPGRSEGESDDGLTWSRDVSAVPQRDDDKVSLHAAKVIVTVNWQDGHRSLTLSTLELLPQEIAR